MARGEDLVLKISADTSGVAHGLDPMSKALDGLGKDADAASEELGQLDKAAQKLGDTDITLSVEDQAIARARQRIDELRNKIAENVIMGVSTKEAEKEMASLQGSVRKLTAETNVVKVDVEETGAEEAIAGIEPLREGIRETSMALGDLTNGYSGFATVAMASVPMLADLNETMLDMQNRAQAAGRSMGVLGRATSAVTGFVAGPWGLAISAGVGLLSVWSMKQDEAAKEAKALSESIDFQAGAFDRNNRAIAAKKLEDEGLLKRGKALGLSTEDLTSVLLGNADATDRVGRALVAMQDFSDIGGKGMDKAGRAAGDFQTELYELSVTMGTAAGSQQRVNDAIGHTATNMADTADAVHENVSVWDAYGKAIGDAQSELDAMIDSLDILDGRFASVQDATSGYQQSIDDLSGAIKENGRTATAHGKALDLSTEKGRTNERMLRDTAASIATLAEARLKDADASGESTDEITADYEAQRIALYHSARQMGLSQDAANEYVAALLKTPKELTTAVKTSGVPQARDEIQSVAKDQTVAIYVTTPNIDRVAQQFKNKVNQMSRFLDEAPGLSTTPQMAPAPAPGPAPTVFMQPRIFLDSQPIRAVLRGDVQSMVNATVAATRNPGRM